MLAYQNAMRGGTGSKKGKRHLTLGNHVVVGAGSVVVRPVPAHSTMAGIPWRVTARVAELEALVRQLAASFSPGQRVVEIEPE